MGVVFGRVQLLVIVDVRVVTFLSVIILTDSPFTRNSIAVRWSVENGWRVRIRISRLRINEAVGLLDRFKVIVDATVIVASITMTQRLWQCRSDLLWYSCIPRRSQLIVS